MKPAIDAYSLAYLTAIGMPARLNRERPAEIEPDETPSEPPSIGHRIRQWLSRASERWRRPEAGQYETYLPEWLGL